MQSLHHFLVIDVAGVVSIISPAHQSHSDVILVSIIQVCVEQEFVIPVVICMPGNILTTLVHWMNGNRTIAVHNDTRISAV